MKLRITTLIIIEEGQVQDIYHSLEDDQDKHLRTQNKLKSKQK